MMTAIGFHHTSNHRKIYKTIVKDVSQSSYAKARKAEFHCKPINLSDGHEVMMDSLKVQNEKKFPI